MSLKYFYYHIIGKKHNIVVFLGIASGRQFQEIPQHMFEGLNYKKYAKDLIKFPFLNMFSEIN